MMEQMVYFVLKYADWIYVGSGILIMILFIYVLHKIKKVEKRNFLFHREIKDQLQQLEKQIGEKQLAAGSSDGTVMAERKEAVNSGLPAEVPKAEETEQNAEPVTLINDVLEEVFP